jgi:ribosomal protein S13
MQDKKRPDWERIEGDYRAGLLSVREIAASQEVSHTAIQKRAKTNGWERDLAAKIKAKADALVAKREVAKEVATAQVETERQLVDANAQVIADIRMAHRKDIARSRSLAMLLLEELERETGDSDLFEELGEILRSEDDKGQDKRNDIYRKVISGAARVDSMKKLAETLKTLIGLEREAYGIAEAQKLDINAKIQSDRKPQELTDDELLAIAAGSRAGAPDTA